MTDETEVQDIAALLDAVRGGDEALPAADWKAWGSMIDRWVEAYPAFGAGRMLRAKTARESRSLGAAERLAEAAVFSSEPGRLFDLLFRSGIEAEIASFARAVEALEPEVEDALRLRWHPDAPVSVDEATVPEAGEVEEPAVGADLPEAKDAEPPLKLEVPEKGTLAREVVLGAIERSIEKEIRELSGENEPIPDGEGAPEVGPTPAAVPSEPPVDVARLSPLARWAYERGKETGFVEAAESRLPSEALREAARRIEEVMDGPDGVAPEAPKGGLEQQAALIDLFIRNEPTIGPVQPDVDRPGIKELAKESLVEDASLITETMARIYAAQGQIGRARRAYKLLALKYPEKSVYFAAQSKKLGRKSDED